MTYRIFLETTEKVIVRGTVRPYYNSDNPNLRIQKSAGPLTPTSDELQHNLIISDDKHIAKTLGEITKSKTIPTIDPYDLLGFTSIKEHVGSNMKTTVKEIIDEEKMIVEYGNEDLEIMDIIEIENYFNKRNDNDHTWAFDDIIDHKLLNKITSVSYTHLTLPTIA